MDGVSLLPTIRDPRKRPNRRDPDRGARPALQGQPPGQPVGPALQGRSHRPLHLRRLQRRPATQELYDRRKDPYQLRNVAAVRAVREGQEGARAEARQARQLQGPLVHGQAVRAAALVGRRRARAGRGPGAPAPPRSPASTTPATARSSSCKGALPDATRHGLEHDRAEPLPGQLVERLRRRRAGEGARRHGRRAERPAPLPDGLGHRHAGPRALLPRRADAEGRDDPDPQRRRPRPDARTPTASSSAATPGAGTRGRVVYELVAPGGDVYVMQAYSQIVRPEAADRQAAHARRAGSTCRPAGATACAACAHELAVTPIRAATPRSSRTSSRTPTSCARATRRAGPRKRRAREHRGHDDTNGPGGHARHDRGRRAPSRARRSAPARSSWSARSRTGASPARFRLLLQARLDLRHRRRCRSRSPGTRSTSAAPRASPPAPAPTAGISSGALQAHDTTRSTARTA